MGSENSHEDFESSETGQPQRPKEVTGRKPYLEKNFYRAQTFRFNADQNFLFGSMFVGKGDASMHRPMLAFRLKIGEKRVFDISAENADEVVNLLMKMAMFVREHKDGAEDGLRKSREEYVAMLKRKGDIY